MGAMFISLCSGQTQLADKDPERVRSGQVAMPRPEWAATYGDSEQWPYPPDRGQLANDEGEIRIAAQQAERVTALGAAQRGIELRQRAHAAAG